MAKVYVRPDADIVRYISNYSEYSGKEDKTERRGVFP